MCVLVVLKVECGMRISKQSLSFCLLKGFARVRRPGRVVICTSLEFMEAPSRGPRLVVTRAQLQQSEGDLLQT